MRATRNFEIFEAVVWLTWQAGLTCCQTGNTQFVRDSQLNHAELLMGEHTPITEQLVVQQMSSHESRGLILSVLRDTAGRNSLTDDVGRTA